MDRDELYRVLTLFLVATLVVNADYSSVTFPASVLVGLAYYAALLVVVVAPSYLLADLILVALDRLSIYETDTE